MGLVLTADVCGITTGSRTECNGVSESVGISNSEPVLASEGNLPALPAFPSAGAVLHSQGTCKPCAWFWKPQGCKSGAECRHCHLCSPEEKQRRKVVKKLCLHAGLKRKAAQDSLFAKQDKTGCDF